MQMSHVESCDLNRIRCVWVIQIYIFVGCRMTSWLAYQQSEEMSGLPRHCNYSNISTIQSAQFPQSIMWSVENTDSDNGPSHNWSCLQLSSCHTQATHNPTFQYVPSIAFRFSAVPNMTSDDNMLLQLYTDWLVLRRPGHWWSHHPQKNMLWIWHCPLTEIWTAGFGLPYGRAHVTLHPATTALYLWP